MTPLAVFDVSHTVYICMYTYSHAAHSTSRPLSNVELSIQRHSVDGDRLKMPSGGSSIIGGGEQLQTAVRGLELNLLATFELAMSQHTLAHGMHVHCICSGTSV